MKGYRPPRILTQADVSMIPKIQFRTKVQNNGFDTKSQKGSTPKLSVRLDPINPQQIKGSQLSSRRSSSLNNLNRKYFLEPLNRNLMKNLLRESYSKQIQSEQKRKKTERTQQLQSQKEYLTRFQKVGEVESQKRRKIREEYKRQLQAEIKERKVLIDHAKTQETALERAFQEPRNSCLAHKSGSFKKFYEQASKYQKRVEEEYKGYMSKEQQYIKTRNIDKISDFGPHYDLMMHQKREQTKLEKERKMELRKMLDQQIQSKQKEREQGSEISRNVGGFQNLYNPIVNPIDYKMDIRNKYVMGQLIKTNRQTTEALQ